MELQFPRMKPFVVRNGKGIEVFANMQVEAGEELLMRIENRALKFGLGEQLRFSAQHFEELAFACYQFAVALASRQPKVLPAPIS